MTPLKLLPRSVSKVWGRRDLGLGFGEDAVPGEEPVGEIWFETPNRDAKELLIKYLFTSQKLSVQVHPDDVAARAAGHDRGKDECWLILAADAGATIGLGLRTPISAEALRAAARDGSIEAMLEWRKVKAGDIYYLPAGTIHAIGAGIALIEVQQNVDLTYRLYDYGRPRELHLNEAIGVARRETWQAPAAARNIAGGRRVLAEGGKFVVELWTNSRAGRLVPKQPIWLIPISGHGQVGADTLGPGEVWIAEDVMALEYKGYLLIAYSGDKVADGLWNPG